MLVPEQPLDAWVKSAVVRAQATVTILDRNGNVLGEAGQEVRIIEWADQPEVRSALTGKVGSAVRRDAASGEEFLYVAMPLSNSQVAAIRLATSLEPVHALSAALFYRLLVICLIALAVASVVAYRFLKSGSRAAARLEAYAEHLLDPHVTAV